MFTIIRKSKLLKQQEELTSLKNKLEHTYEQYRRLESRVKEVEDSYTAKSGIKIRNDITQVFCKFSKIDMIIMMSGVYSLMKNSTNVNDITAYTELVGRMQSYIDRMSDDQ